jgi:F-type H+-transporting ATPase subunit alpha
MPVEEQVVAIFAGVRGYLDPITVEQIGRFESRFLADMRSKHADVLATIRQSGEISAATEASLKGILDSFAKSFV